MKPKASPLFMILGYMAMFFFFIWTIFPLIWLIYSSFKTHLEIITSVFALPKKLYLGNFINAFREGGLGWFTFNSIVLSLSTTIIVIFISTLSGFAFAKIDNKLTPFLYGFIMLGLLITAQSTLIPIFLTEIKFHLNDTYIGLLIPYVAFSLPFAVYLARSYMDSLRNEVFEAAVLDGANLWQIYWDIIFPMSRPIIATIGIFTFLGIWNEFSLALVLTSDDSVRTLPVGINSLLGGLVTDYGLQMATLLYGMLPLIFFYIIFRKELLKGFGSGSVKG
ncbi:MAG: carbohydrate ABC transporter permease [Ostreibacterium sp.]